VLRAGARVWHLKAAAAAAAAAAERLRALPRAVYVCRDNPGSIKKYISSNYALHSFESPTGYKLMMTSSKDAGELRPVLAELFVNIFLPAVVFNPLYEMGTEITCPLFVTAVHSYISSLPCFPAPAAAS
jgi:hypothetical protein